MTTQTEKPKRDYIAIAVSGMPDDCRDAFDAMLAAEDNWKTVQEAALRRAGLVPEGRTPLIYRPKFANSDPSYTLDDHKRARQSVDLKAIAATSQPAASSTRRR